MGARVVAAEIRHFGYDDLDRAIARASGQADRREAGTTNEEPRGRVGGPTSS